MDYLNSIIGNFKYSKNNNLDLNYIENFKVYVYDILSGLDYEDLHYSDDNTLLIISYDHSGTSENNISILISAEYDGHGFFCEYCIHSYLDGDRDYSDNIPIGKEDLLFDLFYKTVMSKTKYFNK